MKRLKLGQITAPVGIRGEIRVYPYMEQTRFSDIKKVVVETASPVDVEKCRADKNMIVLKLSGTEDRNAAELLRGKYIYLPEGEELDLGADTYLVERLEGSEVVTEDGSPVGTLKSVISRPAQDLYEIEMPGEKTFLLPAVKAFVLSVDTAAGKITVRLPEGITEL